MRKILLALFLLLATAGLIALHALGEARRDPVVRDATIRLPHWPAGRPPVRAVLISDVHIGNRAMDAARLDRVVGRINALHPDIVLIAGDFIAGERPGTAAREGRAMVAPLSRLRAPLGVVAVLGNHDWTTGAAAVRAQLADAGVTLLENRAILRGPLAIGGIGDATTRHASPRETIAAMRRLPGAPVMITHSPDIASTMLAGAPLLLAGHTHCGQIVAPFWGSVAPLRPLLRQRLCGLYREPDRAFVITGGLGTSAAPFRLNAPPDIWLLTLGP